MEEQAHAAFRPSTIMELQQLNHILSEEVCSLQRQTQKKHEVFNDNEHLHLQEEFKEAQQQVKSLLEELASMEKSKDEQHQRDYKQLKKKNTILEQELQILRHKSSQQKGKSSNGAGVGGGNSRAGEATSSLQPEGASRPGSQKPRRAAVPDPFLPGKLEDDKARLLAEAEAGLKALRKDNQQLVAAVAESSAVLVALAERRAEAQGEVAALRAAAVETSAVLGALAERRAEVQGEVAVAEVATRVG